MASGAPAIQVEKSESDHRAYRHITLPNKMDCLLVSDPRTDKSAAALEVAVGSASDPIPGLAHFCEHMLFLGTEKYPDENSYSAFLAEHGGSSNAYTAHENTNYHFDVTPENLEPALDRFSQFFISPLFTKSATDREMQAVHNEDAKNKLDDAWRGMQLLQATSNPEHAFHNFGTGNLTTLRDEPLKLGQDVRAMLLDFHAKFYSANQMKLCIVGKDSLDQLQEWAQNKFSAVENKDRPDLEFGGNIFLPGNLKKVYKVVPIKELRQMAMLWHIPPETPVYQEKPIHLLSHMLGHEGAGSLLSYLKRKGWVNGLGSGLQQQCREFAVFALSMDLTEEGVDHTHEIAEAVFAYINLLNTCDEAEWRRHFDEAAKIADMNFRFQGIDPPLLFASNMAANMNEYPPDHVISGAWKYWRFDNDVLRRYLGHLTPEQLRIHVTDPSFKGQTDQVERWYGTEYTMEDIADEQLRRYAGARQPELHLPLENPFIPFRFELKRPDVEELKAQEEKECDDRVKEVPVQITNLEEDGIQTWWKQDDTFFRPHGHVFLHFDTPIGYGSPEAHVLSALFIKLVDDSLTEYTYDAVMAGFSFNASTDDSGVTIHVKGYDHKLDVLLDALLKRMRDLAVNEDRFGLIRESFQRKLRNFDRRQPYMHAIYNATYCMMNRVWHDYEQLAVIEKLTADDLRSFIPQLLDRGRLQMMVFGNFTQDEARGLALQARDALSLKPLWPGMTPDLRYVALQSGVRYRHSWKAPNPAEINSSTIYAYELGRYVPERDAVVSLLGQIMQEPAFNQLRTKEQLGYLVWSGVGHEKGLLFLRILVQSSDRSAEYLEGRVAAFVEQFGEMLEAMDEESFNHHKQSLIAQRLEKDKTSKEESHRHWGEISNRLYLFDRAKQDAEQIAKLSKEDVIQLYRESVTVGAPQRRLLITRVEGNPVESAPMLPNEEVDVEAIVSEAEGLEEAGMSQADMELEVPTPAECDLPEPEPEAAEPLRPVPEDSSPLVDIEDPVAFKKSQPLHPQYV